MSRFRSQSAAALLLLLALGPSRSLADGGIEHRERQARPILDYAERLFERKSFKLSLTEAEQEALARVK